MIDGWLIDSTMTETTTRPGTSPLKLPLPFATSQPQPTIITQGAEALLYHTTYLTPSHQAVIKFRPTKNYRHPDLDKRLTRHRVLTEARILVKCRREGVAVPGVLSLDADGGGLRGGGGWIILELIEGTTVKEALQVGRDGIKRNHIDDAGRLMWTEAVDDLLERIGRAIGRLHEVGVIHGDLTTSNLMVRSKRTNESKSAKQSADSTSQDASDLTTNLQGDIVLIDFGLATQSLQDEDKAVDLYVLERAFGSTHPEVEDRFGKLLEVYGESYQGAKVVLRRLGDVRMRGRKRNMVG